MTAQEIVARYYDAWQTTEKSRGVGAELAMAVKAGVWICWRGGRQPGNRKPV
jgi:hypothetical protein